MKKYFYFALILLCLLINQCFAYEMKNLVRFSSAERIRNLVRKDPELLKRKPYRFSTLMHAACELNRPDIVKVLIDSGVDINITNLHGQTPLHIAAFKGNAKVVKVLLKNKSNPKARDYKGKTPLHYAAQSGSLDTVKLLLSSGSSINELTFPERESALMIALKNKHYELAEFFISKGTILKYPDSYRYLPISYAAVSRNCKILDKLIDKGSPINIKDILGETPLLKCYSAYYCSGKGPIPNKAALLLISRGAEIKGIDNNGDSVLGIAAKYNDKEVVKAILEKGEDHLYKNGIPKKDILLGYLVTSNVNKVKEILKKYPRLKNYKCKLGLNLIHFAARSSNAEMIKYLISIGFDKNARDDSKRTPMHQAAMFDNPVAIKTLHSLGVNLDVIDKYDDRPLAKAAGYNSLNAARTLIELGDDINYYNKESSAPLYEAVMNNNPEMVKFLISKGADIEATDEGSQDLLETMTYRGELETMKILIKNDAKFGNSVYRAAEEKNMKALKLLLDNGGNIDSVCSKDRESPLYAAFDNLFVGDKKLDIARFLLKKGAKIEIKENSCPVLFGAVETGDIDIIETIWKKIKKENVNSEDLLVSLTYLPVRAIKNNNLELLKFLLNRWIGVKKHPDDYTRLLGSAVYYNRIDIAEFLIERGAKIDGAGKLISEAATKKYTLLYHILKSKGGKDNIFSACATGNIEFVKSCIKKNPAIVNYEFDSRTPLMIALLNRNDDLAMFLINNGADVYKKVHLPSFNSFQELPITFIAASGGCNKTLKYLISKGFDISEKDRDGQTLLHRAVFSPKIETAKILIDNGTPLNKSAYVVGPPIVLAAYAGNWKMVSFLLKNGVDINEKIGKKQSLRDELIGYIFGQLTQKKLLFAEKFILTNWNSIDKSIKINWGILNGRKVVIEKLIKEGMEVNKEYEFITNYKKRKRPFFTSRITTLPLNIAAESNSKELVELLIKKGADVNLADGFGWTPLKLAQANGYDEIVKILRKHGAKK